MKKTNILFVVIFMIVAVVVIGGAWTIQQQSKVFFETAEKTTAAISDIEIRKYEQNGETKYEHSVYVTYEVGGVVYEHISLGYYSSSMSQGDEVEVYYNPENPKEIKSKTGVNLLITMMYVMGGIVFAVAIIYIIISFLRKNRGNIKTDKKENIM